MKRGHLIAYDETGRSWVLEGEAEGDILPHIMPIGQIKVVELENGALSNAKSFKYSDSNGLEVILNDDVVEDDEINLALLKAEGVIE